MDDLNHIRCVFKSMEDEKNEVVCENQQLSQLLNDMKDELCQMKRINDQLSDDLETSNRQVKTLQNENCKLSNCITNKNEEIRELQKVFQEVDRLKCYVCQLEKEKVCYSKAMDRAEETNQELERCVHEKDCALRRMQAKVEDLQREIACLEKTVCRLQNENDMIRRDLEECQDALHKSEMEFEALCQKLKCMEMIKQKLQDCMKQLQTNLCHAENGLNQERMSNKKLKDRICECQNEYQRQITENLCLEEQNNDMNCKLQTCCKILNKTRQELECVKTEFENYRQNIGELKDQLASQKFSCRKKQSLVSHKFSGRNPSSLARRATKCFSGGTLSVSVTTMPRPSRTKKIKSRFSSCAGRR